MRRICETCRHSVEERPEDEYSIYGCTVADQPAALDGDGLDRRMEVDDWRDRCLLCGGDGRECQPWAPDCPAWEEGA